MVLENGIFFWSHAVENAEHLRLQSCFRPRDVMIDVIIDAKMRTLTVFVMLMNKIWCMAMAMLQSTCTRGMPPSWCFIQLPTDSSRPIRMINVGNMNATLLKRS